MFQAYGTVSKIESFRGDCKGRIEDFGGNRRIIKSQGKICVPWKSLIVRKIIKIAHPKKDRPFKANDYKSAIYTARRKASMRIKPRNTRQRAPLLLQLKNLFHQAPLLVAREGGVGALGFGDVGFPFGLAGHGSEAFPIFLPVKIVHSVADHKDVGTAAEDLHVEDSDLLLAFHDFRPDVFVDVAVTPDHVRVVHQFKGLAVSFHMFFYLDSFTSFGMTGPARNDRRCAGKTLLPPNMQLYRLRVLASKRHRIIHHQREVAATTGTGHLPGQHTGNGSPFVDIRLY